MKVNGPQNIPLNNPRESAPKIPKQYTEVAKGMEKQFLKHMFEEMRKTVERSQEPSSATQFYESLQDSERADIVANNGEGIGIQKMVLDQILPQRYKDNHLKNSITKYQNNKGVNHE